MIPRKRRTREHIIADQSINHLERFIIDAGHVAERVDKDYGYDLLMMTFDGDGYAEPGLLLFQVKASERLTASGADYVFDIDIRDYNLWIGEARPVILVLYEASRRKAFWVCVQEYFEKHPDRMPKPGRRTVRVRIPARHVLNHRAIGRMRELKRRGVPTR